MGGRDDKISRTLRCKALCRTSPEKKGAGPVREPRDHLPRQTRPAEFRVPLWHARGRCQGCVQEKNALIGPEAQIAIFRCRAKIALHLLEDVGERPGQGVCASRGRE